MKNLKFQIKVQSTKAKPIYIKTQDEAFKLVRECFDPNTIEWKESAFVICMSQNARVLGWYQIADGSIDKCLVDLKVLFQVVLLSNATSFIFAHNHPSGSLLISKSDITMTNNINDAAKMFEIKMLYSLIITKDGCKSINN